MAQPCAQPAPTPDPEADRPEGRPRWPAWFAPVGFLTAAWIVIVSAVVVRALATALRVPPVAPPLSIAQTLIQDFVLIATAVAFASRVARPRAWHFGLGRAPLERALRWAGLALTAYLGFLVIALVYRALFHPSGQQRIVEALGADRGLPWVVAGALLVIVVAPVAEELFFRGFFFAALRTRFNFAIAASLSAALFALTHFTGRQTLSLLPLLAVLGVLFCLLYERTGSLYPGIALHAVNNSVAYAGLAEAKGLEGGAAAAGGLGLAMLAASVVAPALRRPAATSPG